MFKAAMSHNILQLAKVTHNWADYFIDWKCSKGCQNWNFHLSPAFGVSKLYYCIRRSLLLLVKCKTVQQQGDKETLYTIFRMKNAMPLVNRGRLLYSVVALWKLALKKNVTLVAFGLLFSALGIIPQTEADCSETCLQVVEGPRSKPTTPLQNLVQNLGQAKVFLEYSNPIIYVYCVGSQILIEVRLNP